MTLATKLILIAALVLSIFIPFGYYLLGEKNKGRYKCALAFNVLSYFGTFLVAGIMLFGSVPVHAADAAASGAGLQPVLVTLQQLLLPVFPASVAVLP